MVFHLAADLPAVASWHHDVEENDRRLFPLERFHRFVAVVCNRNRITACLEIIADYVGVVVIVVHNKNRGKLGVGHSSYFGVEGSTYQVHDSCSKRLSLTDVGLKGTIIVFVAERQHVAYSSAALRIALCTSAFGRRPECHVCCDSQLPDYRNRHCLRRKSSRKSRGHFAPGWRHPSVGFQWRRWPIHPWRIIGGKSESSGPSSWLRAAQRE